MDLSFAKRAARRAPWRVILGCTLIAAAGIGFIIVGCGGSQIADAVAGDGGDATVDGLAPDGASSSLAPGAVLDGGSPADAGPGGNTTAIPCGTVICPTSGALCCAYPSSGATGFSYSCVGGSTCPIGDAGGGQTPTVLQCTSTANCTDGKVCCVRPNDDNQGAQSSTAVCKASCGANEAQLCDPTATVTGCSPSAPCSSANIASWELPSTFATCGGVLAGGSNGGNP